MDDFCMKAEDEVQIVRADGGSEDLEQPGLYILDLRLTDDLVGRAGKTASILSHVFRRAKETDGISRRSSCWMRPRTMPPSSTRVG